MVSSSNQRVIQITRHSLIYGIHPTNCSDETRLLKVRVTRADNLAGKDIFRTSDPYCKVTLINAAAASAPFGQNATTRIVKRCLNPVWNEEMIFRVNPSSHCLVLQLFDQNRLTRDDFLGIVKINLSRLDISTEENGINILNTKFSLQPRSVRSRVKGSLTLRLAYIPSSVNPRILLTSDIPNDLLMPGSVLDRTNNSENQTESLTDEPNADSRVNGDHSVVSDVIVDSYESVADNETSAVPIVSASVDETSSVDALPSGWGERVDQNGRTYYVDYVNKRTQWDRPSAQIPVGWEQRTDRNGRVYYIDHVTRRITWYRPTNRSSRSPSTNLEIINVSNGHQSASSTRRSDQARPLPRPFPSTNVTEQNSNSNQARGVSCSVQNSHSSSSTDQPSESVSSGSDQITNSDQIDLNELSSLQQFRVDDSEQAAHTMYLRRRQVSMEDTLSRLTLDIDSNSIENMDEPVIESSDTVDIENNGVESDVNTSSQSPNLSVVVVGIDEEVGEEPLPEGWQLGRTGSGRKFFINHNAQTTTWDDPRVKTAASSDTTNGSQLAQSADRHLMKELGPLPPGWEERVHDTGRVFYINHNARTTQWQDPRLESLGGPAVPYSRDYRRKYEFFRSTLKPPHDPQGKFELYISRKDVFQDSFRLIYNAKKPEILTHRLWVEFIGEKGLDYGGVQREWFFLLSREMFNPYYGLFEYSAADNYTLQINPASGTIDQDHLKYFKFVGRIMGMAVYHGKLIDGFFIRPFYKMMLNKPIILKDMEAVDSEYYRSLKHILNEDPIDLCLTMSVQEERFGETVEIDLVPNGHNINVTNKNKAKYIELIINWRFVSRVQPQMRAILEGFSDLIPLESLQIFDPIELELLISGLQDIDVRDWEANTLYKGEYHAHHPVVANFWKAVFTFPNELRSRLLQFVTGTSRVPMNGFAELWGSNGLQKFTIECWGDTNQLPRAHTCFNRLDLPPYKTFPELRRKLIIAMENSSGFEGVD